MTIACRTGLLQMERELALIRLGNEVSLKKFYLSGEPETTPNYPLQDYNHPMFPRHFEDGEMRMCLEQNVTAPGQMLIVENTDISCVCLRDRFPYTEKPSTPDPTTVLSPSSERIPLEAHKHLANKFARILTQMVAANFKDEGTVELQLQLTRKLDARRHPRAVIPVNFQGGVNPGSSKESRGPWNEVEGEGQKFTLNSERVWNIIANNAICFKARSKSLEPSQVETCESWGMWIAPSFINHSCIPNCHAMRVGDAIIIRAAKAIEAGEELTLPYFDIFQPFCRRNLEAERWGFRCNCRRCIFERLLGPLYETIEEEIVNLEQQIERSWTLKNVKAPGVVSERLLQKLVDQLTPIGELVKTIELGSQQLEINLFERDEIKRCSDCLSASFSESLIAWYALALRMAYENPLPPGSVPRTEKARRLRYLISCVAKILKVLTSVHPGNLLCEEFYSILLKARNELIDDDLDEELTADLASQESYVRMANKFSCSYYGPYVRVFNP